MTLSLNIIGAGKLGRTLGHLWQRRGTFLVQDVCNNTYKSALEAVAFIGSGCAVERIDDLRDADCWLIATKDSQIATVADQLAKRLERSSDGGPQLDGHSQPKIVVFHCSGTLTSKVLSACTHAALASAHPAHSFASPADSAREFAGSTVAIEGDRAAVELLAKCFGDLSCPTITIDPERKEIYHAATVMACNYLTGLMDLSLRAFEAAGISQSLSLALVGPLVVQTARNNATLGPLQSLTGPIARGDTATVAAHIDALRRIDPNLAAHYCQLGLACVDLALRGDLDETVAAELKRVLQDESTRGKSLGQG